MLPVWVLGYEEFNVEETVDELLEETKSGLLAGWSSAGVADAEQVLQILEEHGLNRIGNRADAYAENVARFLEADSVVLLFCFRSDRIVASTVGKQAGSL